MRIVKKNTEPPNYCRLKNFQELKLLIFGSEEETSVADYRIRINSNDGGR